MLRYVIENELGMRREESGLEREEARACLKLKVYWVVRVGSL